jgi:hypothetical protein
MKEKNKVLYIHKRKDNGEVFYVGIGNSKRPYVKNKRSVWWKNIVKEHGYEIEILKENITWEEACELEKFYIKEFGRKDLGMGSLVNMSDGGDGLFNPSDEWKKNNSERNTGKNNPNYGKIGYWNGKKRSGWTEEMKKKLSDKMKGKSPWNKGKTGVYSEDSLKKMSESIKKSKKIKLLDFSINN